MSSRDVRCGNGILFGYLLDGVLEVKCRSARCGARRGVVVLHRFSMQNGELLGTLVLKDPAFAISQSVTGKE